MVANLFERKHLLDYDPFVVMMLVFVVLEKQGIRVAMNSSMKMKICAKIVVCNFSLDYVFIFKK